MEDNSIPKFEDTLPTEDNIPRFEDTVDVSDISTTESALKGAQQGVTAGFSDEASGGIQALLDRLNRAGNAVGLMGPSPTQVSEQLASEGFTGDIGPVSPSELYTEARDQERAAIMAAEQANPKSFLGGAVGGGLLSTALPGMGLGGVAKGAGVAEKTLAGAQAGAKLGAITGAGMSEAESLPELAGDVAQGAFIGGGTGAVASGALGALGAMSSSATSGARGAIKPQTITQAVEQSPVGDLTEIFKRAASGKSLAGKRPELTKQIQEEGIEVFKSLRNKALDLEEQKQSLLGSSDKKIDLTKLIDDYSSKVKSFKSPDLDVKKLQEGIDDFVNELKSSSNLTSSSTKEAYEIKQLLQKASGDLKNPQLQKLTNDAAKNLQNQLDEVIPGIKQLNKTQSNLISQTESMFGVKPLDYIPDAEMPAFLKKTGETFEKFSKDSAAQQAISKEATLGGFKNLKGEEVPGLEKLVPESSKLVSKAKETARDLDLSKKIDKQTDGSITNLLNAYRLAEVSGRLVGGAKSFVNSATNAAKPISENLSKVSDKMRAAVPEQLTEMADDITRKMGEKAAVEANILRKASEQRGVSRDALLFSLMQRPGFREYVNESSKEENE